VTGSTVRFSEKELLPLSGLQHLVFCERQAALIHVEQLWRDNALTIDGSHRHARVHDAGPRRERRGDLVIVRGLALRSLALGLSGRADVVEFHRRGGSTPSTTTITLTGLPGCWSPYPVEYKRGKPKADRCDEVQLCAQALCIEEMLSCEVPEGALFYGREQRRCTVSLDTELRRLTKTTAARLHELVGNCETPRAHKQKKCRKCSLLEVCMPEAMTRRSASGYLRRIVDDIDSGGV